MRLLIDENATPVAVHSSSDIPIHFRDKVKAALERDVRLGVIERVDMGTPVTWCQRMMIAAKANGEPRIDFNRVAKRDTHHSSRPDRYGYRRLEQLSFVIRYPSTKMTDTSRLS